MQDVFLEQLCGDVFVDQLFLCIGEGYDYCVDFVGGDVGIQLFDVQVFCYCFVFVVVVK